MFEGEVEERVRSGSSRARTDIVLGDDWIGPGDAVETEVRASRARRGLLTISTSPLARKIALFNLVALVILIGGVLLTNPTRETLLRQQEEILLNNVRLLAGLVAEAQDLTAVAAVLERLDAGSPRFQLMLVGPAGDVLATLHGRDSAAATADPSSRTTPVSYLLRSIWAGLLKIMSIDRDDSRTRDFAQVAADMFARNQAGLVASHLHFDVDETLWIAASAPVIREGRFLGALVLSRDSSDTASLMRQDREQVFQFFLIALLVSVGLSLVLASTIANPLADLAMAAELGKRRDARKSKPGARVRIPDLSGRPDEIGDLSRAMRGIINALYDRVEANEQFAADVAHEIKNPLASLRSAVSSLRKAKRADQTLRLLDVIEHDVRRLDRLVSDTANASRLDAELMKEEQARFDLVKLLENLSEYLSLQAREQGVEFIRTLPDTPIEMTGLEGRLAQVFVNLVSNAISFCEEGDAVRVWARRREDRVLIVVEDTGPGIPDAALKKVFKRFYSERPEQQFGNHSGLGLAISKQIVEAHQGVIWAENIRRPEADPDSPPLGARFVVGLPL
ncbi:MAG: ATP-binding protein [Roseinatronobacter sp.]